MNLSVFELVRLGEEMLLSTTTAAKLCILSCSSFTLCLSVPAIISW